MEIIENRENELRLETGIALGKICKIIKCHSIALIIFGIFNSSVPYRCYNKRVN